VVAVGVTVVEPEAATVPTPGDIDTPVVLVVVQVSTTVSPISIEDLLAVNELIEGGLYAGAGLVSGMSGG
jgi:hypothetical protein